MCTPFDPRVAFLFAGMAAIAASASLQWARALHADQRGFTLTGMSYLAIVLAAFTIIILAITTRCYRTAVPLDVVPIALRAGAIQTGAPAPAGTRAPACESGGYCTSPGRFCAPGKACRDTYEWDAAASQWRCGCDCRD